MLAQIVDPAGGRGRACGAGVGATIAVTLGGAHATRALHADAGQGAGAGSCRTASARLETMKLGLDAGPTAVLTFDNYTVVVFSRTHQPVRPRDVLCQRAATRRTST